MTPVNATREGDPRMPQAETAKAAAEEPEPQIDWSKIPVETPLGEQYDGFHDVEG